MVGKWGWSRRSWGRVNNNQDTLYEKYFSIKNVIIYSGGGESSSKYQLSQDVKFNKSQVLGVPVKILTSDQGGCTGLC